VLGAHDAVEPLQAQRHADALDHQRQELLIVLIEGAGASNSSVMSRLVIGSAACRRIDSTALVISPCRAQSGGGAERLRLDRLNLVSRVELQDNRVQLFEILDHPPQALVGGLDLARRARPDASQARSTTLLSFAPLTLDTSFSPPPSTPPSAPMAVISKPF
jgi:hypothetical protein